MLEIADLDLCGLARAIADGEISSSRATEIALNSLDTTGRRLNAVVRLDREKAMTDARAADQARRLNHPLSPLHGVPLAHKDVFYREGEECACGSKLRAGFRAGATSTVLRRLDQAGAIDIGRLQLSEFAMSPTGYNGHHDHPRNPWDSNFVPGGSSSGSAIAVAARLVSGSLGTDTGGSLRHPAAMCGVVGMKPTWTLVPSDHTMPLAASLDCIGPITRTAKDAARLLSVIAARDYETPIVAHGAASAIAIPGGFYREELHPDVECALNEVGRTFRDLGCLVTETMPPDMETINSLMRLVMSAEIAALHKRWVQERPHDYSLQVRSRLTAGLSFAATSYIEAQTLRLSVTRQWIESCMGAADAVLIPCIPIPVPTIAETTIDEDDMDRMIDRITRCTRAINYLGLPAVSVPCCFDRAGLPIGFQLVGRPFAEAAILRIADLYQSVWRGVRKTPDGRPLFHA